MSDKFSVDAKMLLQKFSVSESEKELQSSISRPMTSVEQNEIDGKTGEKPGNIYLKLDNLMSQFLDTNDEKVLLKIVSILNKVLPINDDNVLMYIASILNRLNKIPSSLSLNQLSLSNLKKLYKSVTSPTVRDIIAAEINEKIKRHNLRPVLDKLVLSQSVSLTAQVLDQIPSIEDIVSDYRFVSWSYENLEKLFNTVTNPEVKELIVRTIANKLQRDTNFDTTGNPLSDSDWGIIFSIYKNFFKKVPSMSEEKEKILQTMSGETAKSLQKIHDIYNQYHYGAWLPNPPVSRILIEETIQLYKNLIQCLGGDTSPIDDIVGQYFPELQTKRVRPKRRVDKIQKMFNEEFIDYKQESELLRKIRWFLRKTMLKFFFEYMETLPEKFFQPILSEPMSPQCKEELLSAIKRHGITAYEDLTNNFHITNITSVSSKRIATQPNWITSERMVDDAVSSPPHKFMEETISAEIELSYKKLSERIIIQQQNSNYFNCDDVKKILKSFADQAFNVYIETYWKNIFSELYTIARSHGVFLKPMEDFVPQPTLKSPDLNSISQDLISDLESVQFSLSHARGIIEKFKKLYSAFSKLDAVSAMANYPRIIDALASFIKTNRELKANIPPNDLYKFEEDSPFWALPVFISNNPEEAKQEMTNRVQEAIEVLQNVINTYVETAESRETDDKSITIPDTSTSDTDDYAGWFK